MRRCHAVGDHGRAAHGVEAVLPVVGAHRGSPELGLWREGPQETGIREQAETPSSPAAPRSHPLPQEELKGEVVHWDFCHHPLPAWLTPKVGLSIPMFSTHLTHREAHQGHQEQGEQGVMAGGQSAEWEQGCESSWSLIQLRPGLGQGTQWVGQPALPELLVSWRCCIPAQKGNEDGKVIARPEVPTGSLGRGATQLSLEGFLEKETQMRRGEGSRGDTSMRHQCLQKPRPMHTRGNATARGGVPSELEEKA